MRQDHAIKEILVRWNTTQDEEEDAESNQDKIADWPPLQQDVDPVWNESEHDGASGIELTFEE